MAVPSGLKVGESVAVQMLVLKKDAKVPGTVLRKQIERSEWSGQLHE